MKKRSPLCFPRKFLSLCLGLTLSLTSACQVADQVAIDCAYDPDLTHTPAVKHCVEGARLAEARARAWAKENRTLGWVVVMPTLLEFQAVEADALKDCENTREDAEGVRGCQAGVRKFADRLKLHSSTP